MEMEVKGKQQIYPPSDGPTTQKSLSQQILALGVRPIELCVYSAARTVSLFHQGCLSYFVVEA
jgi:hypothetical protein